MQSKVLNENDISDEIGIKLLLFIMHFRGSFAKLQSSVQMRKIPIEYRE
jgi:hypothetical protein